MKHPITRRQFLQEAAAYTVLAGGAAEFAEFVSTRRTHIAVVGLGARGQRYLRTLAGIEGVDIVALCDRQLARVREATLRLCDSHTPAGYNDALQVLQHKGVGGVVLAVPESEELYLLPKFLNRGFAVFSERPLVTFPANEQRYFEKISAISGRVTHAKPIGMEQPVRARMAGYVRRAQSVNQVSVRSSMHWPRDVASEHDRFRTLIDHFSSALAQCLPAFQSWDYGLVASSFSPAADLFGGPWVLHLTSSRQHDPKAIIEVHTRALTEGQNRDSFSARFETSEGTTEWITSVDSSFLKPLASFVAQSSSVTTHPLPGLLHEQWIAQRLASEAAISFCGKNDLHELLNR